MGILHDELRRLAGVQWTDASSPAAVLRRILSNRGIELSDERFRSLIRDVMRGADSVELQCGEADQSIAITDEDIERAMAELASAHDGNVERAVARIVEEFSPRILQSLYAALPQSLREWRAEQRQFEERLYDRWKDGLDRLDMLITMAHEAAELYTADLNRELLEEEPHPDPVLMHVLTALHCRACRTAREMLCLLKSGYADGAHARWRSLHELAMTAYFLLEHRGNTAQRYLDHSVVERFRAASQYQQHCQTLGYDPVSTQEMAELKKAVDAAIARYGAPFREDYGWAAEALQSARPTFAQIEASLDMAHWRPWFRLACQCVHAGSQGLHFALGAFQVAPEMLLAGASDCGLADPGHLMAISLVMVTSALLTVHTNLDGLITCQCMQNVCDDIGREMLRIQQPEAVAASPQSDGDGP